MTDRQNAAQAVGGGVRAPVAKLRVAANDNDEARRRAEVLHALIHKPRMAKRISTGKPFGYVAKVRRSSKGDEAEFWKNIDKQSDVVWMWVGRTTTNHNTVDCAKYEYGHFEIEGHQSKLAHRIMVYLTYGCELSSEFEVFAFDDNRLNIHPDNLGIRNVNTRQEQRASDFFAAANDNRDSGMKVAA